MSHDNDQLFNALARRHSRDQSIIAVLSFLCVVLALLSFSGINLFMASTLFAGPHASQLYWLQWLILGISIATYFTFVGGNRRLDLANAIAEQDVEAARVQAHEALERLDDAFDRNGIDSRRQPS